MEIPTNLKKEIDDFCKANNIEDIDQFIIKVLKRGFTMEKYGITPAFDKINEVLADNVREIRVEVIPKVSVQDINVEMEIRPTDKKDMYGE
jgi:hypothetical protein